MPGKPLSTIVEELNNVLTVVAMCTDELESACPREAPMSDLRDAVRRGAELTRLLSQLHPKSLPPPNESGPAVMSEIQPTASTILLVEDDHTSRRSVIGEMDGRGWRVVGAESIAEAFKSLETVRAVDVLVIDTATTSRRFASQLVERYPTAAVVYLGGYTDERPLRDELPKTEVSLVCRPFEPTALVARIGETLARRR